MGALRLLAVLALVGGLGPLAGALVVPSGVAWAQTAPVAGPTAADPDAAIDFDAWDDFATGAEAQVANAQTPDAELIALRAALVEWRARFLEAQTANSAPIATIRDQIAALGPAPEGGASEAPEIAARRAELAEQLSRVQAPALAADEAWRRADALVSAIDRALRDRQTQELLEIDPAPINPANWPDAARVLQRLAAAASAEVAAALGDDWRNAPALRNLPVILGTLVMALMLIARGRRWLGQAQARAQSATGPAWRPLWEGLFSLGRVLVPTLGALLVALALDAAGLTQGVTGALSDLLPVIGFVLAVSLWLSERLYGSAVSAPLLLPDAPERCAALRSTTAALGGVYALYLLADGLIYALPAPGASPAGRAVLLAPVLVLAGITLWRAGRLLRAPLPAPDLPEGGDEAPEEPPASLEDRLVRLFGLAAVAIGLLAPVLALVGYLGAAQALVLPAIVSLALGGGLVVLHRAAVALIRLVPAGLMGHRAPAPGAEADGAARSGGLIEVLVAALLVAGALPLFALIWGARVTDIAEVWARVQTGFRFGDTRIAPGDFVAFLLVFVIGYAITRLVQGTLRNSVLPKTRIDQGGRTAIVSGVGYVGFFLAALMAVTSAGIDLSSLAIVAGALSVGIGFGLQNIVSNFVSGIILLIERPVSVGDWIEVGGVSGTVREISVRSTRIETFDRTNVIVPNSDLVSGMVTNWTRHSLTGRIILKVGVAYGTDTRKVERILQEIGASHPMVQRYPAPFVLFAGFGADALDFELRLILRDINAGMGVRNELNHQIAERFAAEGIEIPYAQRDIWLRNPEALANAAGLAGPGQGAAAAPPAAAPATPAPSGAGYLPGELSGVEDAGPDAPDGPDGGGGGRG